MTKTQAYQPSLAQHQRPAMPCARWTQQRHALALPLSPYARAGQGARLAPRLEIGARSLHSVKVAAHVSDRHPAADRGNNGLGTIGVCHTDNLNFSGFDMGADSLICQTLTGGEGGGLDLDKCLHGVAPVDALILAQDARIKTTVRRKVLALRECLPVQRGLL